MSDRVVVQNNQPGIGLLGAVFLVFLTLKLIGVITWSWWWVTAPLWGGLALALVIIVVTLLVTVLLDWRNNRRRKRARSSK